MRNIAVIVGGDLGRSGRIARHAIALAAFGGADLFGFIDTPLPPELTRSPVRVHRLRSFERLRARGPFFAIAAVLRQCALSFQLAWKLAAARPALLLVQNPPAFPLLPIAMLSGAPVVIDWHNFTASMLRARIGSGWLTSFVSRLELRLARRAAGHLCVSNALRAALAEAGITATTLYDAIPSPPLLTSRPPRDGAFRVMVPSSWSVDDDFGLLEEAVRILSSRAPLPDIVFVLTGTGERKKEQMARFESLSRAALRFETQWYPADEYLPALAAADLGLSLHRSTSGVDLPLKLFEMLGCRLPVAILDYGPVLRERFDRASGIRFFTDATELADLLEELVRHPDRLASMRAGIPPPRLISDEWRDTAAPFFERLLEECAR